MTPDHRRLDRIDTARENQVPLLAPFLPVLLAPGLVAGVLA